jgi:hypothetical protein
LYWADSGGLRKMPIGGGPVTTLLAGGPVRDIALTATRVVYSVRTSIRSMPKTGGPQTTLVGSFWSFTPVTTLFVWGTTLYWGTASGAVRSLSPVAPGGTVTTHLPTDPHPSPRTIESVSFDGTRVLWTVCLDPGSYCLVISHAPGPGQVSTAMKSILGVPGYDTTRLKVLGDAKRLFWSSWSIYRYTY